MEHTTMRALLEDTRLELGALFEHGLAAGGGREDPLRQCAGRLEAAGLTQGAELMAGLCDQLAASRLDPRWQAGDAAALLARLWRYTGLCLRRLELLEAKAALAE